MTGSIAFIRPDSCDDPTHASRQGDHEEEDEVAEDQAAEDQARMTAIPIRAHALASNPCRTGWQGCAWQTRAAAVGAEQREHDE